MSKLTSSDLRLKKLKRQAHKLAKLLSIPKHAALQKIAELEGFDSWFSCKKSIDASRQSNDDNLRKSYTHELHNGTLLTEQVAGVEKNADGLLNTRIKKSHLNFVGSQFLSPTAFRNELEHHIKDVIAVSKGSLIIALKVYIDQNTADLIHSSGDFFYSIQDRYPRIHEMDVTLVKDSDALNNFLFNTLSSMEND